MFRTKMTALVLVFAIALVSCTGPYVVHPGSINVVDSKTYDTLIIAQAAIQTGHQQLVDGRMDDHLKPYLLALEKSYNIAIPAYKSWHMANAGNANATLSLEVITAMNSLTNALAAFQKGGK